ncbi:MAG: hypoxanthine phosphoribosyltransferase [Nitrospirae bacterium]|nr:hypoxanthine phosphoribosyltransferase [Nitrospirota bacterium]
MIAVDDNVSVLVSEASIRKRISCLAKDICKDFSEDIHGVLILKGSIVFFADLIREINRCSGKQVLIEVMEVSSYEKTESTGTITIKKDAGNLEGKDVLIVEDVVDTGLTLHHLKRHLAEDKKARSVKICCLTDKPCKRKTDICADYTGFILPDKFIVGYGIDYDQKYRSLPYIGFLKKY